MRSTRSKRRLPTFRQAVVVLFFAVLALVMAKAAWGVYGKARHSAYELQLADARLAELQVRDAYISNQIDRLRTPEGVEAELRSKFGVVREGERTIVIVDEDASAASGTATTTPSFFHSVKAFFSE